MPDSSTLFPFGDETLASEWSPVPAALPAPTEAGLEALARFNERWAERQALHRRLASPPWWAPGLILTPTIHATYERCLPVARWRTELAMVLAAAFPMPTLQPVAWRSASWASLPALWRELPPPFAGRVTVEPERLFALACALASPLRFGTAAGRYPEQRGMIRHWREERDDGRHAERTEGGRASTRGHVLDIGCGTGQGTWELATWLAADTVDGRWWLAGLTLEPLEAWMAGMRWLPHLELGNLAEAFPFPPWPPSLPEGDGVDTETVGRATRPPRPPQFGAASIFALPCPAGSVDLLVCNGLAGGPALRRTADIAAAWRELARVLAPGGMLLVGNTFHGGRHADVAAFHAAADPMLRRVAEVGRSVAWHRLG